MTERFNNPFASLGPLKGRESPPAREAEPPPAAAAPGTARTFARAVVRMERAGRGGKEVTVIEQLGLNGSERETWLRELKAALGCGGAVDGETLVLQGDHRKRLPEILTRHGVKRVITG